MLTEMICLGKYGDVRADNGIVSRSQIVDGLYEQIRDIGESFTDPILVAGETGTGKELVTRAIHYNSKRKEGPLIKVSCPNIPEKIAESELFGHKKGAYTDARTERKGKFKAANGGTLILNEISELELSVQPKLLDVLDGDINHRKLTRVGEEETYDVSVRVIAATNRDLRDMVKEGKFYESLFHRLYPPDIVLPPLRERADDIPVLIAYFFKKISEGTGREFEVSDEALQILCDYNWPGNVRQLRRVVEGLARKKRCGVISKDEVKEFIDYYGSTERFEEESFEKGYLDGSRQGKLNTHRERRLLNDGLTMPRIIRDTEEGLIREALHRSDNNQVKAAKILGITRDTIRYRIKQYRICERGAQANQNPLSEVNSNKKILKADEAVRSLPLPDVNNNEKTLKADKAVRALLKQGYGLRETVTSLFTAALELTEGDKMKAAKMVGTTLKEFLQIESSIQKNGRKRESRKKMRSSKKL